MLKLTKIMLVFIFSSSTVNAMVFTVDQITEAQRIIGYDANAQITGQSMALEEARDFGSSKREESEDCTKSQCNVGHVFSTESAIARGTQLEKSGFIKDSNGVIQNNKGYLDKAIAEIAFLSGGYTECKPGQDITKSSSIETCDEYFDVKHSSCFPKQVIEIDPRYTYQCSKKRELKDKVCTDTLTSLKCKNSGECDNGGIVLKSLASDMKWDYRYPILTLGTIADNYWRASCGQFVRSTRFEVKNLSLIQEFRITQVGYDDYLRITLNGTQVFNGPFGGEKLEIKTQGVDTGSAGIRACELAVNRRNYVNIDLIPYLKEGTNELVMEVVVAGAGEGWAKIRTKQHCCTEWEETREEKCIFT